MSDAMIDGVHPQEDKDADIKEIFIETQKLFKDLLKEMERTSSFQLKIFEEFGTTIKNLGSIINKFDETMKNTSAYEKTEKTERKQEKQAEKEEKEKDKKEERDNRKYYTDSQSEFIDHQKKQIGRLNEYLSVNQELVNSLKQDHSSIKRYLEYTSQPDVKDRRSGIAKEYGDERWKMADAQTGAFLKDFFIGKSLLLQKLTGNYVDAPGSRQQQRAEDKSTLLDQYKNLDTTEVTANRLGAERGEEQRKAYLRHKDQSSKRNIGLLEKQSDFLRGTDGTSYSPTDVSPEATTTSKQFFLPSPDKQFLLPAPDEMKRVGSSSTIQGEYTPIVTPETKSLMQDFFRRGGDKEKSVTAGSSGSINPTKGDLMKLPKEHAMGFLYIGNLLEDFFGQKKDKKTQTTGGGIIGDVITDGIGGLLGKVLPAIGSFLISPAGIVILAGLLGAAAIIALIHQISKPWSKEQITDEVKKNLKAKQSEGTGINLDFIEKMSEASGMSKEEVLKIAKEEKISVSGLTDSGSVPQEGMRGLKEIETKHSKDIKELTNTDGWKTPGLYWWMRLDKKNNPQYYFSKENSTEATSSSKVLSDEDKVLLVQNRYKREGKSRTFTSPEDKKEALNIFNTAMDTGYLRQFQKGGLVPFNSPTIPGISSGDNVPALLEKGEYVIPKNLTAMLARQEIAPLETKKIEEELSKHTVVLNELLSTLKMNVEATGKIKLDLPENVTEKNDFSTKKQFAPTM